MTEYARTRTTGAPCGGEDVPLGRYRSQRSIEAVDELAKRESALTGSRPQPFDDGLALVIGSEYPGAGIAGLNHS